MVSIRSVLLLALFGGLVATSLHAGGGGSKRVATIHLTNSSSQLVGVTSDANGAAIAAAIADKNLTEFTNAGGVLVNSGGATSYKIAAGTYTLGAIDTNFDGLISTTVSLGQGQSLTIYIVDDTTATDQIAFSQTSSPIDSSSSSSSGSTTGGSTGATSPGAASPGAASNVQPAAIPAGMAAGGSNLGGGGVGAGGVAGPAVANAQNAANGAAAAKAGAGAAAALAKAQPNRAAAKKKPAAKATKQQNAAGSPSKNSAGK